MTDSDRDSLKTVEDEWLASYAAGGLSPAKRLVIACQATIDARVAERLARMDHVCGAVLEGADGADLSDGFIDRVVGALDGAAPSAFGSAIADEDARGAEDEAPEWAPAPLNRFLRDIGRALAWRPIGPGVARAPLFDAEDGERLYLLRARGGVKIPSHGHRGEEWTLVLQGGYHAGAAGYGVGDLHREDETAEHQIVIDAGEPCISLVAIEGRLRFGNPLLRLLQPFAGV